MQQLQRLLAVLLAVLAVLLAVLAGSDRLQQQRQQLQRLQQLSQPLLHPRVVGSVGAATARSFVVATLRRLGWTVELQEFTAPTPLGRKNFVNVVATRDPRAPHRVTLAAHLDSKRLPSGFVGATDAAVPCATLLLIAETLEPHLRRRDSRTTLQLVFFDGEEALSSWSPSDSLYGSRRLAERWSRSRAQEAQGLRLLVVADLFGHSRPTFRYAPPADAAPGVVAEEVAAFATLVDEERRLRAAGRLADDGGVHVFFRQRLLHDSVADDQVPFRRQMPQLPLLHLISRPFPAQWHTMADSAASVDWSRTADLAVILEAWLLRLLLLPV